MDVPGIIILVGIVAFFWWSRRLGPAPPHTSGASGARGCFEIFFALPFAAGFGILLLFAVAFVVWVLSGGTVNLLR